MRSMIDFFTSLSCSVTNRECPRTFEEDMGCLAADALSVYKCVYSPNYAPNYACVVGFGAIYFYYKVQFDYVCVSHELIPTTRTMWYFFTRH